MYRPFKCTQKCERGFETDVCGDRVDGQFGVSQKLFRFIDPKVVDILMDRNAHLLFKKFTEVVFGKSDLITDRVN